MNVVCVIDDSDRKRELICEAVRSLLPQAQVYQFGRAGEFGVFLRKACRRGELTDWLIISDMMMPLFGGGPIDKKAGLMVLSDLYHCEATCPAIIISSDDVDDDIAEEEYQGYLGSICFSDVLSTGRLKMQLHDMLAEGGVI